MQTVVVTAIFSVLAILVLLQGVRTISRDRDR